MQSLRQVTSLTGVSQFVTGNAVQDQLVYYSHVRQVSERWTLQSAYNNEMAGKNCECEEKKKNGLSLQTYDVHSRKGRKGGKQVKRVYI